MIAPSSPLASRHTGWGRTGLVLFQLLLVSCGRQAPEESPLEETPAEKPVSALFTDVTAEAGITFVHDNGARGQHHLAEIMSGGGAFFDFDGDGWLDIFLVQSGPVELDDNEGLSAFYRNRGDGTFDDVTERTGVRVTGYGMGCAVGDFDGDGDPDLYVTRVGPDILLRNDGGGRFSDITAESGLGDDKFSTSAIWFDLDGDRDLDLYVARYVSWERGRVKACKNPLSGTPDYCNPTAFPTITDLLYRNDGDGRFTDISKTSGVARVPGYGLGVIATDFDRDGSLDLYVANDQSPGMIWMNRGEGLLEEQGLLMGAGLNAESRAIAGMGVIAEDFDGDLDQDLLITNIRDESHLFLRWNEGRFDDRSRQWGQRTWLRPWTGFGLAAFDQDHDTRLDMYIANGAVAALPSPIDQALPYGEPDGFLRSSEQLPFEDATGELGDLAIPDVSRGLAPGDYDNDGDVDLLVMRNGTSPRLLRNEHVNGSGEGAGHWVRFTPRHVAGGSPVANARIVVELGARKILRESRRGHSYLSNGDPRVHFGLGEASRIDRLTITWPDGSEESTADLEVDREIELIRGSVSRGDSR